MPLGCLSVGQLPRAWTTSSETSMPIGQTYCAALALGAGPDPRRGRQLLVHPEHRHADEAARVHVLETRGRAARRTEPAAQAGVETGALGQQFQRGILEVDCDHTRYQLIASNDTDYAPCARRRQ